MNKLQKIILPATTHPKQIIFEERDDGFYNMTTKIHVIDPEKLKLHMKNALLNCLSGLMVVFLLMYYNRITYFTQLRF